jgi:Carboxypeptidase regulatory-like domain
MFQPRRLVLLGTAALMVSLAQGLARSQAPAPPPASTSPSQRTGTTPPNAAKESKSGKHKYSHANDFLIRGTVFTEAARAFPGVQLRIRRATEKKFRWESLTNSRGEFAMRVPQGSEYEVLARAKGFTDQTRAIDAKNGLNEDNLVFRMQPVPGGKK